MPNNHRCRNSVFLKNKNKMQSVDNKSNTLQTSDVVGCQKSETTMPIASGMNKRTKGISRQLIKLFNMIAVFLCTFDESNGRKIDFCTRRSRQNCIGAAF